MPKLEFTEKKISVIEGFAVKFLHAAPGNKGRDVRSDKKNLPSYLYQRKAAGTQTVAAWIESRFSKSFPGYKVEVLDGDGRKVHGKTCFRLSETHTPSPSRGLSHRWVPRRSCPRQGTTRGDVELAVMSAVLGCRSNSTPTPRCQPFSTSGSRRATVERGASRDDHTGRAVRAAMGQACAQRPRLAGVVAPRAVAKVPFEDGANVA